MKQLPIVDTTVDTFYAWIVKTNNIINLVNTEIVTANNSANGATTIGVGYVVGAFGSNTISCDTLAGGNTIATRPITVSTNTVFSGNTVLVTNGLSLGANSIVNDHGVRVVTSGTTSQIVDTFPIASYRSVKYLISITDPTNSVYQLTEILVLHNGTATFSTEYATISTGSSLATFNTDISSGNVRLNVTPAVNPLQINVSRTLLAV